MKEQLGHLMVDIETLGTKSNSVICSMAAVNFSLETGEVGRTFYRTIDIQSCLDLNLKIDGSTLKWWLTQNTIAICDLLENNIELPVALENFWSWFKNNRLDGVKVWGNGSRFDLGLLGDAHVACGMVLPWKHSDERDVRTLVSLRPKIKESMHFDGVKHNPLDDCLHQIKYCCATYSDLKI
jgi:hypothetical protein